MKFVYILGLLFLLSPYAIANNNSIYYLNEGDRLNDIGATEKANKNLPIQLPAKPEYSSKGPNYRLTGDHGNKKLIAEVNGLEYEINLEGGPCFGISHIGDFTLNKQNEALIYSYPCGNCCPPDYKFVLYKGDGNFFVTKQFTSSWKGPTIETWRGKYSIVTEENNEGINTEQRENITKRFILDTTGQISVVEQYEKKYVKTIAEITSSQVAESKKSEGSLLFDIDGDGKKERLTCSLWERWGVLNQCSLYSHDNRKIGDLEIQGKRIGFLSHKTHNVNDIVCDFDEIWQWDKGDYVKNSKL